MVKRMFSKDDGDFTIDLVSIENGIKDFDREIIRH